MKAREKTASEKATSKKVMAYFVHVLDVHGIKAADVGVGLLCSPDIPGKYFSIMRWLLEVWIRSNESTGR